MQVIQEREGLGALPGVSRESETPEEIEILDRMAHLEARLERLGDLIERQMTLQEDRETELEKRLIGKMEGLMRPMEFDRIPSEPRPLDPSIHAERETAEQEDEVTDSEPNEGLFKRALRRFRS